MSRKDCKIIYVLLTRREVKMIGFTRVLFSFLFLFFFFLRFLWTKARSKKIKTEKKEAIIQPFRPIKLGK